MESQMDPQTKHEIKVLALSTLAAIPVAAGIGFDEPVALLRIVELDRPCLAHATSSPGAALA